MIGLTLGLALLAAQPIPYAPDEDAGVSFFQETRLRPGEHLRFLAEEGAGWDDMPIHAGPADTGMYAQPSYDQHLAPGGTLSVDVRLTRRGRTLAKVTLKISVEADRRYLVYAAVQRADPTLGCMGCVGLRSRPISGDRSRRLWLYYSFNGISNPILF